MENIERKISRIRVRRAFKVAKERIEQANDLPELVSAVLELLRTPKHAVYRATKYDSKTGKPIDGAWRIDSKSKVKQLAFRVISADPDYKARVVKVKRVDWDDFKIKKALQEELVANYARSAFDGSITGLRGEQEQEVLFLFSDSRQVGGGHNEPDYYGEFLVLCGGRIV